MVSVGKLDYNDLRLITSETSGFLFNLFSSARKSLWEAHPGGLRAVSSLPHAVRALQGKRRGGRDSAASLDFTL